MGWWDYAKYGVSPLYGGISDAVSGGGPLNSLLGTGQDDPANADRQGLRDQAAMSNSLAAGARQFGDQAAANYNGIDTTNLNQSRDYLQGLATGKNGVSAAQLAQGLQENNAAQAAQAAGASPANSAMAARTAANNMARMGYGYSGQAALAGLQERNAAMQQLGQMDLSRRGQDLSGFGAGYGAANQAYGNAINAYGQAVGNPQKTAGQAVLQTASGLGSMISKSDRNAKTDIRDADERTKKTIAGLKAYSYKYKDKRDGDGEQLGVMAQDLERAGLKHAVIDTPRGKMVHGGKLSTANTAMIAALGRRVAELEKGGK